MLIAWGMGVAVGVSVTVGVADAVGVWEGSAVRLGWTVAVAGNVRVVIGVVIAWLGVELSAELQAILISINTDKKTQPVMIFLIRGESTVRGFIGGFCKFVIITGLTFYGACEEKTASIGKA
jgi:hypothetical protein